MNLNDPSQMCRSCWNGEHGKTNTTAIRGAKLCQCPCHPANRPMPASKANASKVKKARPVQASIEAPTITIGAKS